ncbi:MULTISPECIES: oxidoreductase [Isoptericola]|uniref:Oxidoreductase n=1 Tax=Isoptericola haloaureus TaxID=1542902 RepID=A0ABU7ZAG3_9MICO|nr:oxidoreductase [Isoptericola sp. AK164]
MSLRSALDRLLGRSAPSSPAAAPAGGGRAAAVGHLEEFARTRVGVEAYVEPPNAQTPTTVLLVATTGEWTRRRVPDERTGFEVARSLGVPVYNVRFTGYPQRMRDWNSAQRQARKRR